ncbi:MAG: D-aminoacyl-tRNA deacylase [Candidatus Hodarchaeota archaeon]
MNIRNKLINSKSYKFTETDHYWYNNLIFEFKGFSNKKEESLNSNQIYLGLTRESLIFLNDLNIVNSKINPDFVIFASRHRSEAQRPAFLAHLTGNWSSKAEFGGNPYELSLASALLFKAGFLSLIENSKKYKLLTRFSKDIEVSHHGPTTLEKPIIFMELGSSEQEWKIDEAGEVVASSIINTVFKYLEFKKQNDQRIGLGFGGTHYAPNFQRLVINNNIAMSFICPKYYIQELNKELIIQMIENTLESVDYFIIDWKGTNSEDKKHLIPLLEDFDIPIKKTKEF